MKINNIEISLKQIRQKANGAETVQWERAVYHFLLDWFDASDTIQQKTSGSTRAPKTIGLKKAAMVASARNTIDYFKLQAGQNALLCLPIEYIAGKMMVVRAIVGCLNLVLTEPKGVPVMPDQTIHFAAMVPLQLQNLIENKFDFSPVEKLIVGGASIAYPLMMAIQYLPVEVFSTYGMTETCSHIAIQRVNGNVPDEFYHVLPNISISQNDEGCLIISAPHLSAEVLQTTDLVEIISPLQFRWLGRADNVINSGGIKISPEELEHNIAGIIGRECLVASENDERLGQKLVLVLEGNAGEVDQEHILQQLAQSLGKLLAPKNIRFIDRFARNANMKIERER